MTEERDPRRGFSARRHAAVTPHDTATMPWAASSGYAEYFYVTGAGTVVLTDASGTDTTFTMLANTWLFASGTRVKAASTATGIIGLWN